MKLGRLALAGVLVLAMSMASAYAFELTTQPKELHDALPLSVQGENGIWLLSLDSNTGVYADLSGGQPSITPNGGEPKDIYFGLPTTYSRDAVLRVNFTGAFNTLHIDQTITRLGGGAAAYIEFSIYEGANNFSSPAWSFAPGSRNHPYTLSNDLPLASGSDYFFRVHSDFADIGTLAWQIAVSGTSPIVSPSPIPEPETYAMMLAGLGLLRLAQRRRKTKMQ